VPDICLNPPQLLIEEWFAGTDKRVGSG